MRDGESLFVNLASNVSGQFVQVTYRYLTPQNEIKQGQVTIGPTVAGSVLSQFVPFAEGWLISMAIRCTTAVANGQWTFAQLLQSATSNNSNSLHGLIWEGYVPLNTSTGWPGLPPKEITDGAGTLRSITGTTPGAGVEISETVPNFRRWTLVGLTIFLTSSAAAGNRNIAVVIDDGVNVLFQSQCLFNQIASTVPGYSAPIAQGSQPILAGPQSINLPLPYPMKAGFRLRTQTAGLLAGDQFTAPHYLVNEWGAWDS
jgi:hypothetical protein